MSTSKFWSSTLPPIWPSTVDEALSSPSPLLAIFKVETSEWVQSTLDHTRTKVDTITQNSPDVSDDIWAKPIFSETECANYFYTLTVGDPIRWKILENGNLVDVWFVVERVATPSLPYIKLLRPWGWHYSLHRRSLRPDGKLILKKKNEAWEYKNQVVIVLEPVKRV